MAHCNFGFKIDAAFKANKIDTVAVNKMLDEYWDEIEACLVRQENPVEIQVFGYDDLPLKPLNYILKSWFEDSETVDRIQVTEHKSYASQGGVDWEETIRTLEIYFKTAKTEESKK